MSMFGDYKSYKKYEPAYNEWKEQRDIQEAKRLEYLKQNPEAVNPEDIKRGKTLLRAIDIMDEYSQRNAENMEIATDSVGNTALSFAMMGGVLAGFGVSRIKSVNKFLMSMLTKMKPKTAQIVAAMIPSLVGVIISTAAAFPVFALGAKAEIAASKKGRFEAMKNELSDPKAFAVLTEEQMEEVKNKAEKIPVEEVKGKEKKGFKEGMKLMKEAVWESKEYKIQRKEFEDKINAQSEYFDKDFTPEEIEDAKKDQQLLTKLVEKIDIASQDYAENAELATQTVVTGALAFGALFNILLQKVLHKLKIKSENKIAAITQVLTILVPVIISIFTAQIQKQASRVGRFKVKQELLKHPEQLVYVDDTQTENINNIQVVPQKKQGMLKFLKEAWKNNKEYNEYQKTTAKEEKRLYKAIETMELMPEQTENAKRLQKNTFRTFNKIDENSQKYAENIEALGQAVIYPVSMICSLLGVALGAKFITKSANSKLEMASNMSKYITTVLLSTIPTVLINAYITKEQKKASRVANMMAINELSDYHHFR